MPMNFRKITVLILIPVLVCLLGITAFADDYWSDYRDYSGNIVEVSADITRYATSGTITSQETGNNLYVGATYRYYPSGGASLATKTDGSSSTGHYAQAAFNNSGIHTMYNASYTFSVDINDPPSYDTWRTSHTVTY